MIVLGLLSENTAIDLGLVLILLGAIAGAAKWMGAVIEQLKFIQTDVHEIKVDGKELKKSVAGLDRRVSRLEVRAGLNGERDPTNG